MPQSKDKYWVSQLVSNGKYWVIPLANNHIPCQCNRCKPKGIAPPAMPLGEASVIGGVMPVSETPSNWDIEEDPEID